jgi:cell division protein FtsW
MAVVDVPAVLPPAIAHRRRTRRRLDPFLIGSVLALSTIGLLATYTASYTVAYQDFGDGTYFLKRQVIWFALGLVAAATTGAVDYRTWRRYSGPLLVMTIVALIALLVFGAARFGSTRWVGGGSIQPSELAKLVLILFIADWLAAKKDQVRDFTLGLIPFSMITGFVCSLVLLQPGFSTAVLLGLVAAVMFFVAGADPKHMLQAALAAGGVLLLVMLQAPYRVARWQTFLDPEADPTGAGFQILQSLGAIVRGGLFGVGLGQGQNKHLLPAPHTDAVFAVLAEELGLAGCLVIGALFAVVAWRGYRIAAGAPDQFSSLLAVGITSWFVIQACVNVAVVTAVIPFTGIPLPWISFGGSSLVSCMAGMGVLLNVSGHSEVDRARIYTAVDLRGGNRRTRLSRAHRARRVSQGS